MTDRTPDRPILSVGLAVYNGDQYLASAIESILDQTFRDFELVISDNASTDRTAEIAQRFARADPRIRYHRNAHNIGGANNENLTFELSHGTYFRLAAHDDRCAPTLFAECVEVLEANPGVVLAYTHLVEIDEHDNELGVSREDRGTASTPAGRLRELSSRDHHCEATYGVMRSDIIRKCRLQENYTNSDRVWLCELAMRGPFAVVPKPLFFKRYHAENEYIDWHARMAWFQPGRHHRISIPNWLELRSLLRLCFTAPITAEQRARCLAVIAGWVRRQWRPLARDIAFSALGLLRIRSIAPKSARNWEPAEGSSPATASGQQAP